jgi:CheY-like chemotaxis protein
VRKPRILLAEDEGIVALDVKGQLERLGYEVPAVVSSGEAAVQSATETCPDLMLIDIRLQGAMDGIEAVEVIRACLDIPVLYFTALSDEETVRRAEKTQPCGYVTKPIDGHVLRTSIERALSRRPRRGNPGGGQGVRRDGA